MEEMYWHNYKTGEMDYRTAPTNDEEAIQYIPQVAAAQGLYKIHRELGESVIKAMKKTLMACIDTPQPRCQ